MKKKFILFICNLATIVNISSFTIDRVILSSDPNSAYLEFWPIVAKAWSNMGIKPTLALIAGKETIIDEALGDVIRYEPIEGIPTSLQAQVIRLLLPALYKNQICITSDIDMLPLNEKYFKENVKEYTNDKIVIFRDGDTKNSKTYPMCYIAGSGKTFKEIFKINKPSDIPEIIKKWHREDLGWNTDELLLYRHLNDWGHFNERCIRLGHGVAGRIDRSNWTYEIEKLKRGEYIDAHCPRPYSLYKDTIDPLLQNIKPKLRKRFLENADYGTHMAPLLTAVMNTNGPILEMGCGDFSTPLLHALCSISKRPLLTTDTDNKWLNNFIDLENNWHKFKYVKVYEDDWSKNPKPEIWDKIGNDTHWSVVLIDHRPGERRVEDIIRLRHNVDIFVVHDTQQYSYGYESVLNTFKYKYVYERYSTQTTLVSDRIDISKFFEE